MQVLRAAAAALAGLLVLAVGVSWFLSWRASDNPAKAAFGAVSGHLKGSQLVCESGGGEKNAASWYTAYYEVPTAKASAAALADAVKAAGYKPSSATGSNFTATKDKTELTALISGSNPVTLYCHGSKLDGQPRRPAAGRAIVEFDEKFRP